MPKSSQFTIYEAPELHNAYLSFRPHQPKGPALKILKSCLKLLEAGKVRIDRRISFPWRPRLGDLVLEMKTVSRTNRAILEESRQFIGQQIEGLQYNGGMMRWYRYKPSDEGFQSFACEE